VIAMINWYITLYLGVILLLYLFPYIASFPSLTDYAAGRFGYAGLSRGTNLLLSRLISGDLLAFAIISVLSFGILGGLGFALIILVSLLFFVIIIYQLKKHKTAYSLLDLLHKQTIGFSYPYHSLILLGVNFGNMVLQLVALKCLLGNYFPPGVLVTFFISVFSIAYAGLGGFDALNKGAKPQTFIVFLTTAVISISIFLENGLATTYLDIVGIPYPHLGITDATLLLLTGVVIITTQYLLDNSLWHCIFNLRPQRQYSILMITVFCVLAVTLGYSAITVYGLTQGLGIGDNLIQVLEKNHAVILLNLYIITLFIAVISSYAINLYSAVLIYLNFKKKEPTERTNAQIKSGYFFAFIFTGIVATAFFFFQNISLIDLILILGSIYASFSTSFIYSLFSPSTRCSFRDFIGLIPLVTGIGLFIYSPSYYIPLFCFGLGFFIQVSITFLSKIQSKIIKILQKQHNILQK